VTKKKISSKDTYQTSKASPCSFRCTGLLYVLKTSLKERTITLIIMPESSTGLQTQYIWNKWSISVICQEDVSTSSCSNAMENPETDVDKQLLPVIPLSDSFI